MSGVCGMGCEIALRPTGALAHAGVSSLSRVSYAVSVIESTGYGDRVPKGEDMGGRARHSVRLALACLVCTLLLMCPAIARANTASCRVCLFQQYKADVSGLPNTFDYRVTPEDPMAPRPTDEAGNPIETLSLRRDQQAWLSFSFDDNELTGPGTEVFRYRAEPVTPELPYGLFYVDVLSTGLTAGVNVYYLEVYVTVTSDGTIEEVVPTVHVQGWDGPKVSDPGNAHLNSLGHSPDLGASANRVRNGYVPADPNALGGGGYAGTSDRASSSDAASGNGGSASADAGSNAAGTGANGGSVASGPAAGHSTGATGVAGGANGANGAAGSGTTANGVAGAAGAAGTIAEGVARPPADTDTIGDRGSADGLATTGDATSVTVPLSLALASALLGCVGLTRLLRGKGEDR